MKIKFDYGKECPHPLLIATAIKTVNEVLSKKGGAHIGSVVVYAMELVSI